MTVWPLAMLHAFRGRAAEALAEHDRGLGGCLATGVHDHEPGYALDPRRAAPRGG